MTIKPGRRELADSLLAAQGDGHPDHTIEGAFRDLLDAANRALENRDPDRRILPISLVKVLVEFYGTDVISAGLRNARGEDPSPCGCPFRAGALATRRFGRAAVKPTPNARDRSGSAARDEIEGPQPA